MELTQARLKELLEYDPDTGEFTRRVAIGNQGVGFVAGTIKTDSKGSYYHRLTKVDGKPYMSSHLIILYMTGVLPPDQVDHINGNSLDNRFDNLRLSNKYINMGNQPIHRAEPNRCPGVVWREESQSWRASIAVNNKRKSLGCFKQWWDAVCARKSKENELGIKLC